MLEKTAGKLGWGCQTEKLQHSPYIPLPGDWDQYLAGIDKKQRHEIRRKMRRAGDGMYRVDWYIVEDADRLEEESAAFIEMMAQDPAKQAFLTPAMREAMQEIMRCAFEAGWLHLAFLTFDDMRAAGYLSLLPEPAVGLQLRHGHPLFSLFARLGAARPAAAVGQRERVEGVRLYAVMRSTSTASARSTAR